MKVSAPSSSIETPQSASQRSKNVDLSDYGLEGEWHAHQNYSGNAVYSKDIFNGSTEDPEVISSVEIEERENDFIVALRTADGSQIDSSVHEEESQLKEVIAGKIRDSEENNAWVQDTPAREAKQDRITMQREAAQIKASGMDLNSVESGDLDDSGSHSFSDQSGKGYKVSIEQNDDTSRVTLMNSDNERIDSMTRRFNKQESLDSASRLKNLAQSGMYDAEKPDKEPRLARRNNLGERGPRA